MSDGFHTLLSKYAFVKHYASKYSLYLSITLAFYLTCSKDNQVIYFSFPIRIPNFKLKLNNLSRYRAEKMSVTNGRTDGRKTKSNAGIVILLRIILSSCPTTDK